MHLESGDTLLQEAQEFLQVRSVCEALTKFNAAEAAHADADRCAAGRWMAHMLLGDFEEAWRETDAIRRRGAPDPNRFWMQEPIDGKRVMLRCLHGFGDTVQALRYLRAIQTRAAKLIVEVAPEFVELAGYFHGIDEVITWGEHAPASPPAWDVQMEVAELPYVFRTQLQDLPIAERYLRVTPEAALSAKPHRSRLRVGLVWASGAWNRARSVPVELLRPLLRKSKCEFWNLQGGDALTQAGALADLDNFHTDPSCAHSLLRLAQSIADLDLVITPDTLAAHLAGAIGTPAWVMLQHEADWRWMLHRDDSPWYPSLRLFRQPSEGAWQNVIDEIRETLAALSVSHKEAHFESSVQ